MNLNPLAPTTVTPPTPAQLMQKTLAQIQQVYNMLTPQMLKAYQTLTTLILANPYGLTTEAINAALGTNATILASDAAVLKAVLNYKQPGIIVDALPSATITLPT